jgi:hypothetical protein
MVDHVNQGKGDMMELWKTYDETALMFIELKCNEANEDFYNPSFFFRKKLLDEIRGVGKTL